MLKQEIRSKERPYIIAGSVEITLRDGIIHVTYLDGAEISVEVKRQMFDAFREVTNGEKYPFLYRSAGKLWISREAREYARKMEPSQPCVARAMVAESLGFRLIAEFYNRIYKPAMPYKVFKSEEEALVWLRTFL